MLSPSAISTTPPLSIKPRPAVDWLAAACRALLSVIAAMLLRLVILRRPIELHWAGQVGVFTISFAMCLLANRRLKQWTAARNHWGKAESSLRDAILLIRNGQAAMEELDRVAPELQSLAQHVRELFHDNRLLKSEIRELESEMRQRVANRTDALERSLGAIKQKAARDALTGMFNRRTLDEMLPKFVANAKTGGQLCLLMIDVDDFKVLNDTLGHAAGDNLLRDLGQLMRSSIREVDMGFRYGGDEFVMALPGADRREGEALAARLTSLTDALTKPLKVSRPPRLSIGVVPLSEVRSDGPVTATDLMKAADAVLYANKVARKAGRTRAA